nr:MAG TPA: hypothetical protein [Bacteriophage sp.]
MGTHIITLQIVIDISMYHLTMIEMLILAT